MTWDMVLDGILAIVTVVNLTFAIYYDLEGETAKSTNCLAWAIVSLVVLGMGE